MKVLRRLVFCFLAFVCWLVLSIADEAASDLLLEQSLAGVLMVLACASAALAYTQWFPRRFVVSLTGLTETSRMEVVAAMQSHAEDGIAKFMFVVGWFLILYQLWKAVIFTRPLVTIDPPDPAHEFVVAAAFFIVFGTMWQARILAQVLKKRLTDECATGLVGSGH